MFKPSRACTSKTSPSLTGVFAFCGCGRYGFLAALGCSRILAIVLDQLRLGRARRVHLLARVIQDDAVDQRRDDVHARVERARPRAPNLADAHSRRTIGNHHDTQRKQQRYDRRDHKLAREAPTNRAQRVIDVVQKICCCDLATRSRTRRRRVTAPSRCAAVTGAIAKIYRCRTPRAPPRFQKVRLPPRSTDISAPASSSPFYSEEFTRRSSALPCRVTALPIAPPVLRLNDGPRRLAPTAPCREPTASQQPADPPLPAASTASPTATSPTEPPTPEPKLQP